MKKQSVTTWLFGISCIFLLHILPAHAEVTVYVLSLKGTVNPGTAIHLKTGIRKAEEEGASCLVIELDTPGGLVSSLRRMVQDMMGADLPVVVYVSPSGAQAASAGALIAAAADVTVMAPGTNIGAAHPVGIGGDAGANSTMAKKAENDLAAMARSIATERHRNADWFESAVRQSIAATSAEALELGIIDFTAMDFQELLTKLEGKRVRKGNKTWRISLKGARVVRIEPDLRERFLMLLADPNIAYILMMIGAAGLYFELSHPGVIFPGAIGGISLLLSLFAMQTLPVNVTGLLLILLALLLFTLELFIISHGILGTAGVISLVFGSLMLFDAPSTGISIDPEILWTVVIITGGFMFALALLATRAALLRPRSGMEGMEGEEGTTITATGPEGGKVFVHGEIWKAVSKKNIPPDTAVRVKSIRGMQLEVTTVRKEDQDV
jgi:membrane-bound serine protease (ClpP class)